MVLMVMRRKGSHYVSERYGAFMSMARAEIFVSLRGEVIRMHIKRCSHVDQHSCWGEQ